MTLIAYNFNFRPHYRKSFIHISNIHNEAISNALYILLLKIITRSHKLQMLFVAVSMNSTVTLESPVRWHAPADYNPVSMLSTTAIASVVDIGDFKISTLSTP